MKMTKELKSAVKHMKRMATPEMKKQRIKFAIASMKADKRKGKK